MVLEVVVASHLAHRRAHRIDGRLPVVHSERHPRVARALALVLYIAMLRAATNFGLVKPVRLVRDVSVAVADVSVLLSLPGLASFRW